MPIKTVQAVEWALQQTVTEEGLEVPVTKETVHFLVDKVREYFNANGIEYDSFSYGDLMPYL